MLVVGRVNGMRRGRSACLRGALLLAVAATPLTARGMGSNWLSATSGNWTEATKWSTNPDYPNNGTPIGTTYDAVIGASGSAYTVMLNSSVTVNSLTLNSATATLTHSSGTLTAVNGLSLQAGQYMLGGGTILNSTITASGGAQLIGTSGTLDGVTLNGNLAVSNNSSVAVQNGLTLAGGATVTLGSIGNNTLLSIKPGTQTIGGTGQIVMSGSASTNYINLGENTGPTTLTLGRGSDRAWRRDH